LREFWLKRRDLLLANPRFQRWVSSFPLTKATAEKKANKLFDICAGFVYSQILSACIQLKVFDLLSDGPRSLESLSKDMGLSDNAAANLLDAACSLDLVEKRKDSKYRLGELGAALLGNPGIDAMIQHHDKLYIDLQDPVALLKDLNKPTELSKYWAYAQAQNPEDLQDHQTSEYSQLMSDSMSLLAEDILDSYSFEGHKCLLDLGGGSGTFVINVCKRWTGLQAQLFDLPAVEKLANERMQKHGMANRVSTVPGNLFTSPLPTGADVISLVRICHDHNDEDIRLLLSKVFDALPEGGCLIIAEPMAGTPGAKSVGDAYFGFYLLAMRSGRPRKPEELIQLLHEVGFKSCQQLSTPRPLITQIITANKA
jgi:demethylspheroidene O-methyltransferase